MARSLFKILLPQIIHSSLVVLASLVVTIALDAVFDPKHWLLVGLFNYTWVSVYLLWVTDAFVDPPGNEDAPPRRRPHRVNRDRKVEPVNPNNEEA